MKMKKLVSLAVIFALFVTLFAACGKKDSGSNDGDDSPGASDSAQRGDSLDDTGTASVDAAAQSVQVSEINVGIEADVTDWSPWANGDTGRNQALWGVYQPLIDFQDGEFIPVLLKEYEISEDGMTITGELWDNIYDHEGNHMTADDVVFNYEYALAMYSDLDEMAEEVEATGEYTITWHMRRPLQIAELKGLCGFFFVTRAAYENSSDEMHTQPVGTGPYKLTSRTSGYSFTYEKWEDYWATEDQIRQARDMANVDKINWFVLAESSQRTVALQQGTIDMCGAISAEDLDKFDNKDGYKLFSYPDNLSMILFPNCDETSVCSDVNLRRAICYSVNSEIVLQSVYKGNGTRMYSEAPSWAAGYNPAWEEEENYYQYNPEKAKDYLEESNYNNETLVIICASDENSSATAQVVNQCLSNVGIKSEVKSYEAGVFKEYIQKPDEWDIMVKTQPTSSGFIAPTIYGELSETRFAWKGTINFAYDDELQEYIQICMTESTSTQDNIDHLQHIVVDNCYAMGLCNYYSYVVVPDTVSDICLSYRKTLMPGGCVYTAES